jgi:hypothetical protein
MSYSQQTASMQLTTSAVLYDDYIYLILEIKMLIILCLGVYFVYFGLRAVIIQSCNYNIPQLKLYRLQRKLSR